MVVTDDGNTLFVGDGSSSVAVFDLASMKLQGSATTQPNVIAVIPTGLSPDYDGQLGNSAPWPGAAAGTLGNTTGIAGCAASSSGRAFLRSKCGDLRGDEMGYDSKDHILGIINGDPGLPFITFIDMSGLVTRPSPATAYRLCRHCRTVLRWATLLALSTLPLVSLDRSIMMARRRTIQAFQLTTFS